ncbi:quinolinate synthase NadA [Cytophagaceae bacterium ABcell3]|nr:quinolinate synthase NadA [Cytophagaceae bacterium ABcell3]
MNWQKKIEKLKAEKNAVILAHYYQDPAIQDIADFIGDSLALSYESAKSSADIIVFAGVAFMAETAKILAPNKKVLLPDPEAGCSLADHCTEAAFSKFVANHPDHLVITYINCSADIKAMSDIICTSSNALGIVNSLPPEQKIIFAPDKNLGNYINIKTGRDMLLWDGSCFIHETFSAKKILELKKEHPEAKILAHPECAHIVIEIADHIGSTNSIINYAVQDKETDTYIIVTESGILHQMQKLIPDKKLIPAPPEFYTSCNCGECPYMKMNTLEKLYNCLYMETPEISLKEDTRAKAEKALKKMFDLSNV